jgi:hypothetical protein
MPVILSTTIPYRHGNMSIRKALEGKLPHLETSVETHSSDWGRGTYCESVNALFDDEGSTLKLIVAMQTHRRSLPVKVTFSMFVVGDKLHIVGRGPILTNSKLRDWAKKRIEQGRLIQREMNYYLTH